MNENEQKEAGPYLKEMTHKATPGSYPGERKE